MEDRIIEITQSEQQSEKIFFLKKEDGIRDFWDNIKQPNICMIEIPEGEEREKGRKNIWIMSESSPNLGEETDIQT